MLILDGDSAANSLAFTSDGTRLVTARANGFDVWSLADGKLTHSVRTRGEDPSRCSVAVHPNGSFAFVAGHVLTAVSLTVADYVVSVRSGNRFDRVVISPDGTRVIASNRDRRLHGYLFYTPHSEFDLVWEVSSQGSSEYPGGFIADQRFVTINSNHLIVRSVTTGEGMLTIPHTAKFGARLLTSPDGSRLAGMSDTRLYVWDTTKWDKPKRVGAPSGEHFRSFAVHPTRPLLAAVQLQQTQVKIFDVETGKVLARYDWQLGELVSVAFSPDGTLAAAGSACGKTVIWDVDT
jgi:WD40 repeat protein